MAKNDVAKYEKIHTKKLAKLKSISQTNLHSMMSKQEGSVEVTEYKDKEDAEQTYGSQERSKMSKQNGLSIFDLNMNNSQMSQIKQ